MPIYEYACPHGHRAELLRRIPDRNRKAPCPTCGALMARQVSRPHIVPDGVYSYAPNIGTAEDFERKRHAIREGIRVQPKDPT